MGCGGSRLGGVAAARAVEGGVVPIPTGIRPLLRRRLEEMKKRSHASVLKGKQTQSKRELLRHGSSEDGEETDENDGSWKSSAKVAPAPDHNVEEKKEVIYEKISSRSDDVKEEEVVKKQEEETQHDETINVKKEGDDGINHDDAINVKKEGDDGVNHDEAINVKKEGDDGVNHDDAINVKEEDDDGINHDEAINVKKEGADGVNHDEAINVKKEREDGINHDDHDKAINAKKDGDDGINHYHDGGNISNFDERVLGPGSPSFKVYCIDVTSDDEEAKDGEDTRKSTDTESVIVEPKEEESVVKKEKRERKGKRFGIALLPRKYLANVTAPCYAGGGGCMGNTHSRLVQEKSSQ